MVKIGTSSGHTADWRYLSVNRFRCAATLSSPRFCLGTVFRHGDYTKSKEG
jgi:hypothetical protein